jgi:hypothetical protein
LTPKLANLKLRSDVIQPVIDIFKINAQSQQVQIVLETDLSELEVEID